jgi:hypothetical protein
MPPPNQQTGSALGAARPACARSCARRHVRVARMEHQRHAHGLERRAGQFGPVLRGRGRQLGPRTCEKPQPARSNTLPPSRIMVRPLPCSGSPGSFCQASAQAGWPSTSPTGAGDALLQPLQQVVCERLGFVAASENQLAAILTARWPMSGGTARRRNDAAAPRRRAAARPSPCRPARSRTARGRRRSPSVAVLACAGMEHHRPRRWALGRPVITSPLRGSSG